MLVLGLAGLAISWSIPGPRYLLLVPGLSERATGKVTSRQLVQAVDGQYEYLVAIVQFTDEKERLHTITWPSNIWGEVQVRYFRLKPDFAIVVGSWQDNVTKVIVQLPCMDLPCLALVTLGIMLYINSGNKPKLPVQR